MPNPFGARRRRIRAAYEALCAAMATADGVAALAAEQARRAHLAATVELWLRQRGVDHPDEAYLVRNPAFADVVRAVDADRSSTVRRPADLLPELDDIVRRGASGSAGATQRWLGTVGDHGGRHDVPGLWRIGTGRIGEAGRPFDVAVPLLDEAHLQIGSHHDAREAALGLVETLLLRVLSRFRPGLVSVHLWDVAQITGPLPRLHPLTRTGLVAVHDPRGLAPLLDELSDRIRRVHRDALAHGHPSVAAWAAAQTRPDAPRPEPWTVAVLVGDRRPLDGDDHAALARVARGGLACGVQLVLVDVPITLAAAVETVEIGADLSARASITGPYVTVELDPRPPDDEVIRAGNRIAERHQELRDRVFTLAELLAEVEPASDSRDGLVVPIGFGDAGTEEIRLDDASPHALIGGPSGSGKTNLLLTWIAALATRYRPRHLQLFLLDFKEGVSFAQLAPDAHGRFLPHARLLGLHVNTDREFGLALLTFLADEMRRRAAAAKEQGVAKLADMADPPARIVAVIDEFQYLFAEHDAVTKAATMLLEDIARRGRSQGIHLVLASQDVSSIDAFWGRAGIFEQFVLRVGLPRARRVLDTRNEATLDLPRWHAVVNHESGLRYDNGIARIPDASTAGVIDDVRVRLHGEYAGAPAPTIFDGSKAPPVEDLLGRLAPAGVPLAVVGQAMDVEASPATVALPDAPGRNVAVLGTGELDAMRVLRGVVAGVVSGAEELAGPVADAAAWAAAEAAAWAGREAAATAAEEAWRDAAAERFPAVVLAPLVPVAELPAARLAGRLMARRDPAFDLEKFDAWLASVPDAASRGLTADVRDALVGRLPDWVTWVGVGGIRARVEALAADVRGRMAGSPGRPTLVVLYAADAADAVLDRSGTEAMRTLLHFGPETGVHVLGWWRTAPRLKALLTMGAVVDDVGSWVALDVQGADLQALLPGTIFSWSPRPGRGLFLDRAQHSAPRVIVVPGGEP